MDFFEWLKEGFQGFTDGLINILPQSPIVFLSSIPEVEKYLGMVNWFIPVYTMIGIAEGWLTAIAIYYVLQVILRWMKVVE